MTQGDPHDQDLVPGTEPSRAAVLEIRLGPDKSARARGSFPPEQGPQLMTTFGIVGCVIGGIAGMDAVLSIRASLIGPAYAVLVLALAGAVMIRFRRAAANLTRRQTASDPGPAAPIKDGRT